MALNKTSITSVEDCFLRLTYMQLLLSDQVKVKCWAPVEKTVHEKIKYNAGLVNMTRKMKKENIITFSNPNTVIYLLIKQ